MSNQDNIDSKELQIVIPYEWCAKDESIQDGRNMWHVRVALSKFPTELPNEANMRIPGNKSELAQTLKKSAQEADSFGWMNLGMTITLPEVIDFPEKQELLLVFTDLTKHGIYNGGHTNEAILAALADGDLQADNWVTLRLYEGDFDTDESVDIMTALNSVRAPRIHQTSDARGLYSKMRKAAVDTAFENWYVDIRKPSGGAANVTTLGQILAAYYFGTPLPTIMTAGKTPLYLNNSKHTDRTVKELREFLKDLTRLLKKIEKTAVAKKILSKDFKFTRTDGIVAPIPPKGFLTSILRLLQDEEELDLSEDMIEELIDCHINFVLKQAAGSIKLTLMNEKYYAALAGRFEKVKEAEAE